LRLFRPLFSQGAFLFIDFTDFFCFSFGLNFKKMGNPLEGAIFTADFQTGGFKKGMTELVESLKGGSVAQKDLQAQFEKTTQELETVQQQLKEANEQLEKNSKGTKDLGASTGQLSQKIEDLTASNANLSVAYKNQQAEMERLKAKNETVIKSIEGVVTVQKKVQETFNKPITPNVNISGLNTTVNEANANLAKLKGNFASLDLTKAIGAEGLQELNESLVGMQGDFQKISEAVSFLNQKLLQTEPGTAEFQQLTEAVKVGEKVLQEYTAIYSKATQEVEKSEPAYKSIRARLAEYRKELDLLEAAGKEETEEFRQVQLAAARLTDQYGDMQQQIAILASDTKYADFGLAAVNAVGAGFQVVAGALTLFGVSSENAQKAQADLLAIMSLVQGVQQLQNLLLKEGVLRTVGQKLATDAYAASQRILSGVINVTNTSSKALNATLAGAGIGALVLAIGYLVYKIYEWNRATDEQAAANERLSQSLERQKQSLKEDVETIDFNTKLREQLLKKRGLSERVIFDNEQIARLAKVKAYEASLEQLRIQSINASDENRAKIIEQQNTIVDEIIKLNKEGKIEQAKIDAKEAEEQRKLQKTEAEKLLALQKQALQKRIEAEKAARTLLKSIREDLAERGLSDEQKEISKLNFEASKQKEILIKGGQSSVDLDKLFAGKRQDVRDKYAKLRADAEREINSELDKLELEASEKRIANIQNTFERERKQIEQEQTQTANDLSERQTALLGKAAKDLQDRVINPEQYSNQVSEINKIFSDLFDSLENETAARNIELGSRILQGTIEGMNNTLSSAINEISANGKTAVEAAAKSFIGGKISYEDYQKELTKITKLENEARLQNTKITLEKEIALLRQRLLGNIGEAEKEAIRNQLSGLENNLAETGAAMAQGDAENLKGEKDRRFKLISDITEAYSSFVNVISGFLDQVSQAEQQRLDRSIALQEKRVAYAKELAEKGNTETLELEQKRLDELQRKREESARKQLAIDNAVRLSQATLAAVSAIAQAAASGNPFAAIAAGVAVLAAIASAYQFANSLQAPTAEFFDGTTFVEGAEGRDKIPAKVTRGEAIIPKEVNKKYSKAVQAIYYESIPASVLNQFVANYPNVNYPSIDYSRLGIATDRHITKGSDREITNRLDQVIKLNETVAEHLQSLGDINLTLDQNGFSMSIVKNLRKQALKWLH
jgi:hypothetical protein